MSPKGESPAGTGRPGQGRYLTALAWRLAGDMPVGLGRSLCRVVADTIWLRRGPYVRRLEAAIAIVTDESESRQRARQAVRSYLRYWYEFMRIPVITSAAVRDDTSGMGLSHLRGSLQEGRGAILALPHMGNLEYAGATLAEEFGSFGTVAKALRDATLQKVVVGARESLGAQVFLLDPADPASRVGAAAGLYRRLRDNKIVCLLVDRHFSGLSADVTLFGQPVRLAAGAAVLAVRTGAPLHPAAVWYDGPRLCCQIHPAIPVPQHGDVDDKVQYLMQRTVDVLEGTLRQHVDDWHVVSRVLPTNM